MKGDQSYMSTGSNTGKRYSDKEKKVILDFVARRGRGGLSEAKQKYGVSYVALKRWMTGKGLRTSTKKKSGKVSKVLPGRIKGLKGLLTMVNKLKAKLESMS